MSNVDDDVAALFALPPEGFTAARDRLVSELRAGGDTESAAAVKALRRPTLVAWAVNAAARTRQDEVARLLDAGARLEDTQRQALAGRGGAADLRAAADERRDAVRALTEAAAEALDAAAKASAPHRDAIASTFEAASVDPAVARRLRAATVEREARPLAGLGGFEALTVLPGGAPAKPASHPPRDPAARRRAREADVRAAADAAKAAAARAKAADAAAARAAARATAARASADKAVAAAQGAESDARRLQDAAAVERRRAAKATEAATKALAALDDTEP